MLVCYFCHTDMHLMHPSGLYPLPDSLDQHLGPRGIRHVQILPSGGAQPLHAAFARQAQPYSLSWMCPEELFLNINIKFLNINIKFFRINEQCISSTFLRTARSWEGLTTGGLFHSKKHNSQSFKAPVSIYCFMFERTDFSFPFLVSLNVGSRITLRA